MENKINIVELLKDCPRGMELDCTIWDSEAKVFLKGILDEDFGYPIEVTVKYNNLECFKTFTKYGAFNDLPYCKCVIFPKGKTTWEGFIPPCKFKDGGIDRCSTSEECCDIAGHKPEELSVDTLQSNKEEIMEELEDKAMAPDLKGQDYSGKRFGYKIPNGYEFDCINRNEIIIKPKQPQYPKTFEECCKVVNASPYVKLVYNLSDGQKYSYDIDNLQVYENIRRLKICRDAYWKIAGEQMGLGKPWEPDWTKDAEKNVFYSIDVENYRNTLLAFPTREMCDAFYENFKELIETCKKLS